MTPSQYTAGSCSSTAPAAASASVPASTSPSAPSPAIPPASALASKPRLGWVDGAKAVAITAIVLCHVWAWFQGFGTPSYITWVHSFVQLFYAFHVAMFFILSGYTMRDGWMGAFGVWKAFKGCYLPYLVSGILIIALGSVLTPQYPMADWLAALAYGAGLYPGPPIAGPPFGILTIGAIWFLPALFVGKVLASAISKIPSQMMRLIVAGILFVIGDQTSSILFLPLGIQAGMNAAWWITCGMLINGNDIFDDGANCWAWRPIFVIPALLYSFMIFFLEIPTPAYASCYFPNGFGLVDMVGTVALSMSIMLVMQRICRFRNIATRGVELLGRSTLPFFCGHAISLAGEATTAAFVTSLCLDHRNTIVLIGATACALAAATLFCVITRYVPGLRYVYYPTLRKKQTRTASPSPSAPSATNTPSMPSATSSPSTREADHPNAPGAGTPPPARSQDRDLRIKL